MLENVARKIVLIALLLGLSLAFLLLRDKPFNLGLDLQGGTRLVYSFDFDKAREEGQIEQGEDPNQILAQTIDIIRNRVDPTGTLEASIRQGGANRIVIELPGTLGVGSQGVQASLAEDLDDGSEGGYLTLGAEAVNFPEAGGVIRIGEEEVRYDRRDGARLLIRNRGHYGTTPRPHAAGTTVELVSDDAIRGAIENLGELQWLILAGSGDLLETDTDEQSERARLEAWVASNPEAPLTDFNNLAREDGGPHPKIHWFPAKPQNEQQELLSELDRAAMVLRPADSETTFLGSDLKRVFNSQDQLGFPAVGFEFKTERKGDFRKYTRDNENRQLAIILNGVLESAPTINSPLPGAGIIQGNFSDDEVKGLITVLRSGSLKIKPQLEHEEKVGATLGADYVQRGLFSGLVAIALVLLFMVFYYRSLGIFASVALLASFLMLMGGLAFLQATLTLPGIAGILLTVGMAVDANILIFDRIREEIDKGRKVKQAAKTGFEKALSAILDANITTLITAIILYKVGTGPVRGFAVTLIIGIITAVFAALVITRVLVHFSLARGASAFPMGTWMVKADYNFLGKAKAAMTASALLVVGGLAWFIVTPDKDKLGIDFTGGSEVQLVTQTPQTIDSMRERVASIAEIGDSVEVKPILNSSAEGGYTGFRAVFKAAGNEDEAGLESDIEKLLETQLSDVLLANPLSIELEGEGATAQARMTLILQDNHSSDDLVARLEQAGLRDVAVNVSANRAGEYTATGTTSAGSSTIELESRIREAFRNQSDSNGQAYAWAEPIPSKTTVGPAVVGELRDKALLALAISLFAIVLYIRARFAEYSYGFAAVVAVFHDVLLTLGVLQLANAVGFLNGEITLPMIAAFLTIIGYSLNDTIVIFDRVRENLPRMKTSLEDVLNTSINQTLSRTILTSVTTFLAVAILFAFNFRTGNVLESFSFAMMVGIVAGTYSTIFIANPTLLWLEGRSQAKKAQRKKAGETSQKKGEDSGVASAEA